MASESPDTIHGRMKEGAHIAGYSLTRTMDNLKWLLEESRFKELSQGYTSVNDFLRDTQTAFNLLKIDPQERKQIAELVKDLQPEASQRAIADMVGVSQETVRRDLGVTNVTKEPEEQAENVTNVTQPWTSQDDYDPSPKEKLKPLMTSNEIAWETPQWLFDLLNTEFNFDIDVCALPENAKCKKYYSPKDDGLKQNWNGRQCWMNPPYGNEIKDWMKKARKEADKGALVVCLIPARMDTGWMWNYCRRSELRFLPGRLKFSNYGAATFPSMLVIMRESDEEFNDLFWDVREPNGLG